MGGQNNLVLARYKTSAAQSINDSAVTIINFDTLVYDPYGLVATGANWAFTANHAGYYAVEVLIMFESTAAWGANEPAELYLYTNGAAFSVLDRKSAHTGLNIMCLEGEDLIYLAAGGTIDIRVDQRSGGALALKNDDTQNHVAIWKV